MKKQPAPDSTHIHGKMIRYAIDSAGCFFPVQAQMFGGIHGVAPPYPRLGRQPVAQSVAIQKPYRPFILV